MSNEYGFFAAKNHDRRYSADDFSAFFSDFFTDGVLGNNTENLMVRASEDMKLTVSGGTAYIKGRWFRRADSTEVTISDSDTLYERYDAVVLRCDYNERSVYIRITEGVPSAAPERPAPVRDTGCYDLVLAYVRVGANVTEITQADICDTRGDSGLCGWVTGVIDKIDTAALFAQYQAAWDNFVLGLGKDERVTIDTADGAAREEIRHIKNRLSMTDI